MLVAWTVLGVWLGLEIDGAVKQRRAVEMVRKLGGMVGYRHQRMGPSNWDPTIESWAPRWLRQLVGDDYFVSVFEVYLAHFGNAADPPRDVLARLADEDLAALAGLKRLERLELAGAPVTPQGLAHLAGLKHLEYLDLRDVTITDQHLEQLGRLRQLKDLRLGSRGQPAVTMQSRICEPSPAICNVARPWLRCI
jgi:hypothetical protein